MKADMRHDLARQPFEEKIRKVGQLIRLSATVRAQRTQEDAQGYPRSDWSSSAVAGNPQATELPPKK